MRIISAHVFCKGYWQRNTDRWSSWYCRCLLRVLRTAACLHAAANELRPHWMATDWIAIGRIIMRKLLINSIPFLLDTMIWGKILINGMGWLTQWPTLSMAHACWSSTVYLNGPHGPRPYHWAKLWIPNTNKPYYAWKFYFPYFLNNLFRLIIVTQIKSIIYLCIKASSLSNLLGIILSNCLSRIVVTISFTSTLHTLKTNFLWDITVKNLNLLRIYLPNWWCHVITYQRAV